MCLIQGAEWLMLVQDGVTEGTGLPAPTSNGKASQSALWHLNLIGAWLVHGQAQRAASKAQGKL